MALNPIVGESKSWNYSRPDKDGYSTSIVGTVVGIQEVQATNFGMDGRPSTPQFWDSGEPKMNIRLILAGKAGGFKTLTFQPASRAAKEGKRKSIHLDLFALAGGKDMMNLIGKTIKISTEEPPNNFSYGRGNPRPWSVELVTDQGPFELKEELDPIYLLPQVYAEKAVSGGAVRQVAAPQGTDDDIPF